VTHDRRQDASVLPPILSPNHAGRHECRSGLDGKAAQKMLVDILIEAFAGTCKDINPALTHESRHRAERDGIEAARAGQFAYRYLLTSCVGHIRHFLSG
jgi:hypothetical protein